MTENELRGACQALLDAAATVGATGVEPPPGEWNADQILAHVTLINAATIATAYSIAAGTNATFDNRTALDPWTLRRVIERAGGSTGLRERIRRQTDALATLGEPVLSPADLDTPVPTLLLSNDELQLDQTVPLKDLIAGLASVELPGHTSQLLALQATRDRTAAAT
jgi:hypothetical protein